MTTLQPIFPERCKGSKFRPVSWSDIYKEGAPVVGWGIEEKPAGRLRYIPRGYNGQIHPFKSKAEAKTVCDELNAKAAL